MLYKNLKSAISLDSPNFVELDSANLARLNTSRKKKTELLGMNEHRLFRAGLICANRRTFAFDPAVITMDYLVRKFLGKSTACSLYLW